MKIYISGKISGLSVEEVREKFAKAETHLKELGHEVINPLKNGLPEGEVWEKYMVADIALLFACEAIYLLPDWMDSRGAMIEKCIAQAIELKILYESRVLLKQPSTQADLVQ
jgi:hypothetical protein